MIKVNVDRFNTYVDDNNILRIYDKKIDKIVLKLNLENVVFVHQYEIIDGIYFAIGVKGKDNYELYLYDSNLDKMGFLAHLKGEYDTSYLGHDCFILNNNSILSLKSYAESGPFDKIIKDKEDSDSALVLVTKNIVNVDAGLVEEMSFLFNLETEQIEGVICSKYQPDDINLMSKQQADKFNELHHIKEEEHYYIKSINLRLLSDYVGIASLRFGVVKPFEVLCEGKTNPSTVVSEYNKTLFKKMKVKRLKTLDQYIEPPSNK